MRFLTLLFMVLITTTAFGQHRYTGKVVDAETGEAILGANVVVKGTTDGTATDINGNFTLNIVGSGTLKISFIGYADILVPFKSSKTNLGIIRMKSDAQNLQELVVVGSGIIDLAENRVTPIASTVIAKTEIQAKAVGNVEFPEIMKNSPNVYVSEQSGGFGDSKMYLRGFDQSNTAYLLNGQPINGMEDGKMYWSNWAGISDIANAIDIQRGLGSSKLAISSVGGTVNIVTKATDKQKGGMARFIYGNGQYLKGTLAYSTGLTSNGWGFSMLLDAWGAERKWADGTRGAGQNYFFSLGKKLGDHNFNFMIFGAPQWHDQNYSKSKELYEKYGKRYNNNWGYLDGEYNSFRRNYYHKPVMNFNWDWNINQKADLSTVLYASFGRGGGLGPYGSSKNIIYDNDGQIDFDKMKANNLQRPNKLGTYSKAIATRASVNNHQWYGAVTNFSYDTKEAWSFNVGADFRFYNGDHFRQLVDLLGLDGWEDSYKRYKESLDANGKYIVTKTYKANPWASLRNFADKKNRIAYDNSEWINYQGVFGQTEYINGNFSAFFQGALSNQSYKKEERFSADHAQSDVLNRIGFNLKTGASYKINENHIIFANVGHYSRQPFLDNIFEYGAINTRTEKVENEKITGLEFGYKAKFGPYTNLFFNTYYTRWDNRFLGASAKDYKTRDGRVIPEVGFRMFSLGQIHKGAELEANTFITPTWKLRGYITYGNWRYAGNTPVQVLDTDKNQEVIEEFDVSLNNTYIGRAPQVSAGLGTSYHYKGFRAYLDFNYYTKLYGFVDIEKMAVASIEGKTYESEKLDGYGLVDLGASYKFFLKGYQGLILRGNIYNLFNNSYISSKDSYGYYYGTGTTFNMSLTYEF